MDPTLLPDLEAGLAMMMQFTDELIAERRASGEPRNDLLQALIAAEDRGDLSGKEVRELLFFLFGAGYDTPRTSLPWRSGCCWTVPNCGSAAPAIGSFVSWR